MTKFSAIEADRPASRELESPTPKAARAFLPEGLPEGTPVLTLTGAVPVERLKPGNRIITRESGPVELLAIQSRMLQSVRPVMIAPGTLNDDQSADEILLAPGQRILLRGDAAIDRFGQSEVITPVIKLCDGETMLQATLPMKMRVFRLDFGAERLIYANGIEVACSPPTDRTRRPNLDTIPDTTPRRLALQDPDKDGTVSPVMVRRVQRRSKDVLLLTQPVD